jgi:hypothetical protein
MQPPQNFLLHEWIETDAQPRLYRGFSWWDATAKPWQNITCSFSPTLTFEIYFLIVSPPVRFAPEWSPSLLTHQPEIYCDSNFKTPTRATTKTKKAK